ncbi:MAG: prepilin peptidase [Candidatus Aenigmarchaeota archaeon]|nr:prepilin peptidase [Candidatus Aenigmarchaeota archaeon]
MIELLAAAIALLGSAAAGIWDLRTTEVPDEIPALMISFGVFLWYAYALSTGDFLPLFYSLAAGTLVLGLGWVLYTRGQWGGADAFILAGIVYALPVYQGNFLAPTYLLNFLVVSSAYMILYALGLGVLHRRVFGLFLDDLRKNSRMVLLLITGCGIVSLLAARAGIGMLALQLFLSMSLLVIFWRYARVIEHQIFRKRVSPSEVKVGDVLEGMIWRGIAEDELRRLRKEKKYVVVKEGVRFVPAFPLTLLVTLLYGNVFFVMLGLY